MKQISLFLLILHSSIIFSQNPVAPVLPNIVSQFPNVRDFAMSPSGNELMFTAQNVMGTLSAIVTVSKENNSWANPKIALFSGLYFDLEPFYSNDGLRLYYVSNRPLTETDNKVKDFDIWYVERKTTNSNWSKPINMGKPINTEKDEFYPSIANNGNLYFTCADPALKSKDDIYVSQFRNGKYSNPKILSEAINTAGYEFNAFISRDESYLLYTCYGRKDGLGSGDLYISYNSPSGWTPVRNMGNKVNSIKMDYCPFVDSKNDILYFTSKRDNTTAPIEKPLSIATFLDEVNKYDNGLSRLYKVSLKEVFKE